MPPTTRAQGAVVVVCAALVACNVVSGADDLTTCSDATCTAASETVTAPTEPPEDAGPRVAAPAPDDAAPSSATRGVACGESTCSGSTPQCCLDGTPRCVSSDDACGGIRVSCDDKSDCDSDTICCARLHRERVACLSKSACDGAAGFVLCRTDDDCPSGKTCRLSLGAIGRTACL